ncbi:MAG: hypothetical protein JSS81_12855 [Acidobacteria bacterium]|nr:hypothetical protein [Acidobacteriota bacterium]
MFFRYRGRLKFESEARAARYYELLTKAADSWYSFVPEELELVGNVVEFKSGGNFAGYGVCEKTKDLINEAARDAASGSVDVDEGDSADDLWNRERISVAHLKKLREKNLRERAKRGFLDYRLTGELRFAAAETATEFLDKLSTDASERESLLDLMESQGRTPKLARAGDRVIFDDAVTAKPAVFEIYFKLLEEFAARAAGGGLEIAAADVYGNPRGVRRLDAGEDG